MILVTVISCNGTVLAWGKVLSNQAVQTFVNRWPGASYMVEYPESK